LRARCSGVILFIAGLDRRRRIGGEVFRHQQR
jgi:hypothetical protein